MYIHVHVYGVCRNIIMWVSMYIYTCTFKYMYIHVHNTVYIDTVRVINSFVDGLLSLLAYMTLYSSQSATPIPNPAISLHVYMYIYVQTLATGNSNSIHKLLRCLLDWQTWWDLTTKNLLYTYNVCISFVSHSKSSS